MDEYYGWSIEMAGLCFVVIGVATAPDDASASPSPH